MFRIFRDFQYCLAVVFNGCSKAAKELQNGFSVPPKILLQNGFSVPPKVLL
jgi:hypothetical protein